MKKKTVPTADGESRPPGKLSGAQYKKIRKLREDAERRADAARAAGASPAEGASALVARYVALGAPPLNDVTRGLIWGNNALLAVIHEAITDAFIDSATRRRIVIEAVRALGAVHSKAHVQERLWRLREFDDDERAEQRDRDLEDGLVPNPLRRRPATEDTDQ